MTDLNRWHLDVKEGRQRWVYSSQEEGARAVQTVVDRYLLGLDTTPMIPETPPARTPLEAARKGAAFYASVQSEDGHWAHDYGGPMFLMPGLIICCYITGTELRSEQKLEMIRYLRSRQNGDGGWGLHIEATSGIFGTGLNYVAMRLLGVPANDCDIVHARKFLLANGGCSWIPQWGKVWFACLGIYSWDGINAIPPELWGLPNWVPFHPGRWWCHCRVVYLPMGYLYGKKVIAKETDLIRELRTYDLIDWAAARDQCSPLDRYKFAMKPKVMDYVFTILNAYEKVHNPTLRAKALNMCLDHIRFEDKFTKFICIGPVNKAFNMLSIFFAEGPDSENFKNHQARIDDYLWLSADGMKMQGYNGSQLWDTAFSVQALVATGLKDSFLVDSLKRAYTYIDLTQVPENVPDMEKYYRHVSKGAWPFSTRDHGWPIADCTGEGLTAALAVRPLQGFRPLDDQRYCDAMLLKVRIVNVVLSLQNTDGGWATYENQRGPAIIEKLNPAEIFYGIMVDYSYTELSASAIVGLSRFRDIMPDHRADEIRRAIARGIDFVKSIQRDDGSWYGCWGVCFLYGTWFGVRALTTVGEKLAKSEPLQRACKFVLSKQQVDGGWGETFESCTTWEYQQNRRSQVVGTAWALLTLLFAEYPECAPMQRGVDFLMKRQLADGNWAQEDISGVFNSTCSISYSGYKNIFPIWALGLFAKRFPSTPAIAARM